MKDAPAWALSLPWNIISKAAKSHRLDERLVAAVIMAESSGETWATRFEPNYKWLHKPEEFATNTAALVTETIHQKTAICRLHSSSRSTARTTVG